MALAFETIRNQLVSHALASGRFDSVNAHPPDQVPGTGVHAIVEFTRMKPASSGLAATSVVVSFAVSVFLSIDQEPADGIDPQAVAAADALFGAYVGDFELGGNVRCLDVRGMDSDGLVADAGYAKVGGVETRAVTITVPVVVNDVYAESP